MNPSLRKLRLSVHGLPVELHCDVPNLDPHLDQLLGEFATDARTNAFSPASGLIRPFNEENVLRHVSPTARRVNSSLELYEEAERFWLIDERWGLAEINLLKGQWQSWILSTARADPAQIVEQAIHWPLAQLLRLRGLTMVPAASVVRGDLGILLISSFSIEPELFALVRAGFKVVGAQWTALRVEAAGRVTMLHLPSQAQFLRDHCGAAQPQARGNAIMLIERGRRPTAAINPIAPEHALAALRSAWPIVELHPQRGHAHLPVQLAQNSTIFQCRLSRDPNDIYTLVNQLSLDRKRAPVTLRPDLKSFTRSQNLRSKVA